MITDGVEVVLSVNCAIAGGDDVESRDGCIFTSLEIDAAIGLVDAIACIDALPWVDPNIDVEDDAEDNAVVVGTSSNVRCGKADSTTHASLDLVESLLGDCTGSDLRFRHLVETPGLHEAAKRKAPSINVRINISIIDTSL
jgi:hypothetical protein